MFNSIRVLLISMIFSTFTLADVFMTELTDPQNSSDAGRYVELHNNGDSAVDLSAGWALMRWTNGNTDPQSPVALTGSIGAGGFYIVCNNADKFSTTYGGTCDQDIGTGGAADSNGDDNVALLDASGAIVDMFGVAGEDGSGTGHEFEDGRAERAESNTSASATWDEAGWNIDNDSGGGDGNQYAPEGFDPGAWIGAAPASDTCEDDSACNTGSEGACEYPAAGYDCDGNCTAEVDCAGVCGGDAVEDECGECGGNGSACADPPENLFFSEAAEGSSNNKYLEIYNATDGDVDLSGYSLSSCSNGCNEVGEWDYADNVTFEEGTIVASGDVYVVCHGSSDDLILAECDQTFTYLSNGDDVFALTQLGTGAVLDVVGLVGDDPGSGWDVAGVEAATKDHTLVRKSEVTTGNPLWLDNPDTGDSGSAGTNADDSEWVVLDQNTWDYLGSHPHDFSTDVLGCMDPDACNYNPDATVEDGSCATVDCAGECGGDAVCEVAVTFSVDMSIEGVSGDVKVRTSTENGDYMPSDWFIMDDADADMVYTYTMMLETGVEYGYNFNDGGYESGDGLADCAGGNYGNDRYVTPGDADMVLGTVCFESCEECPAIVEGCMDDTAINYDPEATVDDGTCEYDTFEAANLFISEAAEGSSNNKYFEVYNASQETVDLSSYAYPTVGNAPSVPGEYEYWNTFEDGASVAAGDVYVVCHGSADEFILAECDEFYTYLSNGDDGLCLVGGSEGNFEILDCVGDWNGDPGSGWDVAGVSAGTKDHTIVRKGSVSSGNDGDWTTSAGTDADDSEWVVFDQNTWDYLGSHPHEFACDDADADDICDDVDDCVGEFDECGVCNGEGIADGECNCDGDIDLGCGCGEAGPSGCDSQCGSDAVVDECGECGGDGSSCACDPGDDNGDGDVNVLDIVAIVGMIVGDTGYYSECADFNADGSVNVLDVVAIVSSIVSARSADATSATMNIEGNTLNISGNGFIGAVQMTLSHGSDFSISLTNDAMVADYVTNNNTTTLMVVVPGSEEIFTASGDYDIEELIVANGNGILNVTEVSSFTLEAAYPNPFNPSTSLNLNMPVEGYVSVKAYNLVGQVVGVIAEGNMDAGSYTMTWDASNLSSGVYLITAEYAGNVATQKVMLMK